ncbi:MAG: hypothetical protein JSV97_13605 [candidate division WOR-3 bacterium]|nr:MAG: hypothetical protein JSV97_13605 [candidate division WOR-3 bacterium]
MNIINQRFFSLHLVSRLNIEKMGEESGEGDIRMPGWLMRLCHVESPA